MKKLCLLTFYCLSIFLTYGCKDSSSIESETLFISAVMDISTNLDAVDLTNVKNSEKNDLVYSNILHKLGTLYILGNNDKSTIDFANIPYYEANELCLAAIFIEEYRPTTELVNLAEYKKYFLSLQPQLIAQVKQSKQKIKDKRNCLQFLKPKGVSLDFIK